MSRRHLGGPPGFGIQRISRKWTGAYSTTGNTIINPMSQTAGGIQVCAAVSLKPQT
jgi:hypothetical protein